MSQKNLWRFFTILFVLVWAAIEMTPPTGRNLIEVFKGTARAKDANFSNIVARAEQLQKENSARTFGNLRDAVGTNDLRPYFPMYETKADKNPNGVILSRLQKEASGKIK